MNRFTVLLLGTGMVLLLATEGLCRWGFDRISRVHRLEISQREALLRVKDNTSSGNPHIAILGNSLLLDGLDVPLLTEKLQAQVTPVPYFVLATEYYDWDFGLKRLFAEGARPRFVLLGLSPNQLASPRSRGDYSAQHLFQKADLMEVAQETHMDATTATGFFLSSFSKFYSTREVTRSFVLRQTLPGVSDLLQTKLANVHAREVPAATLIPLATERLQTLSKLCYANGSQFVLVIPPTYQMGENTIVAVGREFGIPVLVPVGNGVLDQSFYKTDGFHLNEKGSQFFTIQLATELKDELSRMSTN
jgi:hypothetical protein